MKGVTILRYSIAALIVVILGALLGWYLFVSRQVAQTGAADAARGFGTAASFGSSGSYGTVLGSLSGGSASVATQTKAPRLWPVTKTPVAGFGFSASSSRLYYAERATGNVLLADPSDSSIVRLTNTLRPKTYEASFLPDGGVVLRTLAENGVITTFAGAATASATSSEPQALVGRDLPDGILSVSLRPSPDSLFYLVGSADGAAGFTSDWSGKAPKKIFSSALTEWRTYYLPDGTLYIVQKAADGVSGFAFQLKGTSALPYLGPVQGLTILPRNASSALIYGSSGQGGIGLFARASADSSVIQLSVHTTADKCVWAPGKELIAYCAVPVALSDAHFLSDWYMGALHTTDAWYRIDVSSGDAVKLFETDSSLSLDVHEPAIDATGTYLAFRNGYDDTLWMLRITP